VIVFHPAQYKLGRALMANHPGCEIWYGPTHRTFDDERTTDLDLLARQRATFVFDTDPDSPEPGFRQNAELWDRLERLEVARR